MPNRPLKMNKLRTIIRLYTDRVGLRAIAEMARTSRNTVKKYVNKRNTLSLTYKEFLSKSDAELYALFCIEETPVESNPRIDALEAFLPSASKEMGRKGMTSHKQWERYRAAHPDGYSLTQFRVALRRYERISNPSMRMEHKAGDKLFVDYTGSKLWIYPPGEQPREVEVFVAILGCSLLTYVEAVESQRKEDFISACENAFYYYGGVPKAIVPDNLKSAVTKASRYEAILNTEFERFGEHYGVTVYPTRARSPKDKAHVENAVKLTYKDIFTVIEPLHCPDLRSLNIAIRAALEKHNNQNRPRRNYSRRDYFEDVEQEALGPLNPIRYQMKKHIVTTVDKYGYARLHEDIHYYSVPHTYIGKKVQLSYTVADVEIRYNYDIIAHHTRDRHNYRYTTVTEHLCPKHRAVMEWSPERFLQQAAAIHEDVEHYIRRILEKTRYQDQANKICSGILNFARKVGPDRLAAACRLADSYGKYSFREIQDILQNKSEAIDLPEEPADMPEHENIRGKEYYK